MAKKTKGNFDVFTMTLRSRSTLFSSMHSTEEQPLRPPANIQALPEEVLIEIFSYLSLGELCNSVANVCSQWERLHLDRQLYTLPRLLVGEGTIENLLNCLNWAPHLASPYFKAVYMKKVIGKCFKPHHNVTRRRREYTDLTMILSHLRTVNLIEKRPHDGCYWSASKKLSSLLRCCVQLQELRIGSASEIWLEKADLISLCGQLCGTLRVLDLYYCEWSIECTRALTKCRHLEELDINCCTSTESLLDIATMSSLRRLKLRNCSLSRKTLISMISNKALKNLTHLHLKCDFIDVKEAVAIGKLNNLTDLYISIYYDRKAGISNKGLECIIKRCNMLTSLELQCSEFCIFDRGIRGKILKMIPLYLPRLKRLSLGHVAKLVHCTWRSALKKKMPHLVIQD